MKFPIGIMWFPKFEGKNMTNNTRRNNTITWMKVILVPVEYGMWLMGHRDAKS